MIREEGKEDTTSNRWKSQGIELDSRHGRKLRESTMEGGEAGLREEPNQELTSKKEHQLTQLTFQILQN
jgi:hypothetical protein